MEGSGFVVVEVLVGVVAAAVVRSGPPEGVAEDELDDAALGEGGVAASAALDLGGGLGCSLNA